MPAVPTPNSPLATRDDIRRLEQLITALQKAIDRIVHDQDVQFKRIAQLQAEFDLVRGAWTKVKDATPYTGRERRTSQRSKARR